MIKSTLKEANRYDDVINILHNMVSKKDIVPSSLPVNAYVDENGKTKWRVDGKLVVEEASKLLQLINEEMIMETDKRLSDSFWNLYQYVHTHTDTLLHNYSVRISHRKEPLIDMEIIRAWEILDNLIINLTGEDNWRIPEGWKTID